VAQEICTKCKSPYTVIVSKVCRLKWLGYVVRMEGKRTVKKLLEGKTREGRKMSTWIKVDV
jgi:hypothetical protein